MKKDFLILFLFFCLSSCFDIFSYSKSITGNYEIGENPGTTKKDIYYKLANGDAIGRIEAVDSVGWNDSIIVAKSIKGYYILDMKKDSVFAEIKDVVLGPLNYKDFKNQLVTTNIDLIEFEIGFK